VVKGRDISTLEVNEKIKKNTSGFFNLYKKTTIKLQFDQGLNQDLAWDFYNNQVAGDCNFWIERALKNHPW
jgi:hypothetical protein